MPEGNCEALLDFMLKNRSRDISDSEALVREACRVLRPLLEIAEHGKYKLNTERDVPIPYVSRVIANVTVEEVKKIVFVSASAPFLRPQYMTVGAYQKCLAESLSSSLVEGLDYKLKFQAEQEVSLVLSRCIRLGTQLEDRLFSGLYDSIYKCLEESLGEYCRTGFGENVGQALYNCVLFYTGFAMAGNRGMIERLTPLVELLPYTIPVGTKTGEPGTWLVLVA